MVKMIEQKIFFSTNSFDIRLVVDKISTNNFCLNFCMIPPEEGFSKTYKTAYGR
jgi:hypothetical protein